MKKTISKLSAVLMASVLLFGFTGDNLTLREKFDQYEKIPVFFIPGKLGITVPATAAQCPVTKYKIEPPKEYGEVLPLIINALNEGFGFSTFTAGQYDEILVKKITVSGAEVSVPDWTRTDYKFIAICNLKINYEQKKNTAAGTIKGSLIGRVSISFFNVTGNKLEAFGRVGGYYAAYAKSTQYPIESCLGMNAFTEKEAPNSLVEPLKLSVEKDVAKFVEKQMKKYEKAMKKKKK